MECEECGAGFDPKRRKSVTCSVKCYNARYRRLNPIPRTLYQPRQCERCGVSFTPKQAHQRFCRPRCQEAAAGQRWVDRNPDFQRGYYARNRNRKIREAVEWGKANPTKRSRTGARYYLKNKTAHAARVIAWKVANPEAMSRIYRKAGAKRRAILAGLPTEDFTFEEIFDRDDWTCQLCGGLVEPPTPRNALSASLDHIVPISHPDCPGHIRSNVQTAHLACNIRKGNRPPEGGRFR